MIGQLAKDDISVSIGHSVTDPSSDKVFGDYMKIADDEMYKVKVAKKEKGVCRKRCGLFGMVLLALYLG